ncbi:right-handed parallel beta-helix repeat-containing protein, partial [Nitrosopumilus sp.]|nr:right-handed parallel beta-helix repeat-containing protein [Nitrosopumilus sp.]
MKNYNFLVLGFALVGLLFVSPSIAYMVPTAQSAPMDNPADAIDDLSLVSVSKYGNQSDRNSITLSWSAPNDNGSPILFYNIQVHEISGNGWTVLENDVYGTTYTHENAPSPYQFSYRVFAIAADGCNGSSSTFYNACNESNILHVVSLPNAESGAVNSSCNNSDLDDCGYFDSGPATGPFTITDDSTGGDCTTIGDWSSASKTCTLNTDVTATGNNNGISIASNDIILDGAGHTVSSSIEGGLGGNFGVYVDNQLTGFVVKNFNIQGFQSGIKAYNTEGGIITANTVSSPNHIAIEAYSARALQITDNTISNSQRGIEMWNPDGNKQCSGDGSFVVSGNNVGAMGGSGIRSLIADGICFSNNNLESRFSVESDSKDVVIKNNHISGSSHGFDISRTSVLSMTDNIANDNLYNGFRFTDSNIITMTGNTANNNSMNGFTFNENSRASVFTGNTATGNTLNDFDGISETSTEGIVTTSGITLNSNDGGDCSTVGTWDDATKTCTLTTDIIITSNGAGIAIPYANDLILDGAGHIISGTASDIYGNDGVYVSYSTNITIKNLSIIDFKNGIILTQTNGGTVTGNSVTDVFTYGLYVYHTNPPPTGTFLINNNQITNAGINTGNSRSSIEVQGLSGNGACSGTGSVVVQGNTVTSGWGWGITVDSDNSCIDNNTVTGKQSGIHISGPGYSNAQSNNNIISNNVVTSTTATGFSVIGSGNTFDSNTSNGAHDYSGFFFDSRSQNNIIKNNVANNNPEYGFYFDPASIGHTFTGNTATGNGVSDFDGLPAVSSVSVGTLNIGQHGSNAGGDCDSVGTWDAGPEGGTCTLSKDIEITGNGVGIWLASSRVTVDGAGHTVTGNQVSGHDHIGVGTCNQCHTMSVKNLTIENFGYGIRSYNTNGLTITGVTVGTIGTYGMYINSVDSLLLENNIVTSAGIQVFGKNSYIGVGDGTCTGTGQYVAASESINAPIVIKNNHVINSGMYLSDGAGWCIDGNTFTDGYLHVSYAWDQVSSQNHIIKNNVVTGGGITIVGSGNTFDSNTVTGGSIGFHNEHRAHDNIFTNNIANNNSQHGFKFDECEGSGYPECNATPVKFTDNTATGNGVSDFKGAPASCFASSGYSAIWTQDPDTSSRDVTFSGKLAPKQNDQCTLSDELFLDAKTVVVTATKDSVTKSVSATTDDGFFNSLISFGNDSDEGTWTITWFYAGDELYPSTNEFGNGSNSFTLDVPAPPPNLPPIVNVPNDITLYTGTPSFSFAQSTINYNLYSGSSGPVFYPQPTASITGVSSQIATFVVTATDDDLSSGPTCDVTSGSAFPVGTTTVTCTATDSDGGVGTASFDVTVIENTISGSPTCTPGSNSQFPIGSTQVSCSVTDGQGNASTDTFSVNVQPKSPLTDAQCRAAAGGGHDSDSVFVCEYPFHVTVEEGQRLVWVDTQPWQGFYHHSLTSNTGLFDQTDAGVMDMLPSAWGGIGVYSFYDKLNTALSGSITIAASDTTAPRINVPNDMVVSTEDENGTPIVTYSVTATDDRQVVSGPTCNVQSGSAFSIGTTKVTCTASDAAGNTGTDTFDVTVEYTYIDETPPGFAAYDDISKATTNPAGTVVTYTLPTVTDNIAVTSGPTCNVQSGSVFPIGTTEVTCTASDAANNSASISFNVVMTKTFVDNTAPAVYITFGETSDEMTLPADSSSGKELGFTVNAIDNVGVTVGPTCSDAAVSLGVTPNEEAGYYSIDSKMYPIGVSIVVCTASDAAGNMGSSVFAVTVQPYVADTTPPTFTVFPPDITTYQEADVCKFPEFSNTQYMNEWRNSHPGLSDCEGTSAHQTSVWLQVIVSASDNVALVYDNVDDTVANYGYSSSGVNDAVTCTLDDGTDIPNQIGSKFNYDYDLGTHTVTCSASDTSGNTVTNSFTITVTEDTGNVHTSSDDTVPSITGRAFVNTNEFLNLEYIDSDSSTGRTLKLVADGVCINDTQSPPHGYGQSCPESYRSLPLISGWNPDYFNISIDFAIFKDGNPMTPEVFGNYDGQNTVQGLTEYEYQDVIWKTDPNVAFIPIPQDWSAGNYKVIWNVYGCEIGSNPYKESAEWRQIGYTPGFKNHLCFPENSMTFNLPELSVEENTDNVHSPPVVTYPLVVDPTQVEFGESVKIEWTNLHNLGDSQASGWVNQQFLPWEVELNGEEYQFGTMTEASGSTNFPVRATGSFTWTFYEHRHAVIDNTHYSGYKQIYENPIASVSWSVVDSTIQEPTP